MRSHRTATDELLSAGEAGAILGVTRHTMRNWERRGVLMPRLVTLGGHARYLRSEMEALASRGVTKGRGGRPRNA